MPLLLQDLGRIAIGFALEVARVLRLKQHGGRGRDETADVAEVAGDEQRDDRVLQQLPQPVTLLDVARLVRQHAENLAIVLRQFHQPVGDDDHARRQGERIGADRLASSKENRMDCGVRPSGRRNRLERRDDLGLAGELESWTVVKTVLSRIVERVGADQTPRRAPADSSRRCAQSAGTP